MNDYSALVEEVLSDKNLRRMPAQWRGDPILQRLLEPLAARAVAVSTLAKPLGVITKRNVAILAFDYAYFLLIRDLCDGLVANGFSAGAALALFQFELGNQLDHAGLTEEAAGLLRSACELRSSFAVYSAIPSQVVFLYELAVSASIAHEQAHAWFSVDSEARSQWYVEARDWLSHLHRTAPSMYPDATVCADVQATAKAFLQDDGLVEEVACDIQAINHCVETAIAQRPESKEAYIDGYYTALRLTVLALHVARTVATAAQSIVQETMGGSLRDGPRDVSRESTAFVSMLRVRFQVLLLKVASLKIRHGLVPAGAGLRSLGDVIRSNEENFGKLAAGLMVELNQARAGSPVYRSLWIGHAIRLHHGGRPPVDNSHLLALFLREYWFSV